MMMIVIQFISSAFFIVIAGSFLTKFSDKISEVTGWGRMFIGGLLLAGATSLPELMVDLKALKMNLPDLAVGDLLGSCLFNLLILSLLDFLSPSTFRRTAFSPVFLHHSLSAVLTILLTSIVGIGIISKIEISFFGVSIFSWVIVLVYLYGLRLIFKEANDKKSKIAVENEKKKVSWIKNKSLLRPVLGFTISAVVIIIAAPFLVNSADQLAKISGLGHTFIGTTLVALATSLPELVTTLSAFRMRAPDLALGNIFGSNAFNMILFVPLDFMYPRVLFNSVMNIHAVTAFSVVAATSVAVIGQLYRKKERSRLTEPSSEIVVVVILLFLILFYYS